VAVTYPARLVLDTSAYSRLRGGDEGVVDWLAAAAVVFVPAVVLGELQAGFFLGGRRRENEETLRSFLGEPFVELCNIDADVSRRYGEIFAALRRAGTPIPTNDIWIAAVTLVTGGHLLTFDEDFARVGGLLHTVLA
jgi:tRNA(fMet)-specific endonuclease VapC